jgi:hypothetical protein
MPQGYRNAATFTRIVQEVSREAPRSIQKYQDNAFAHHKNILELLQAHQQIFDSLRRYNLVVTCKKAIINAPKLKCLMSGGFTTIDPSWVEAITNVNETMQTKDQVHTFIGLMGYNRGYIPQLASRIAPIHDLLREEHSMDEWKDKVHGQIVRDVKKILTSWPLLKLPDPRKKYYIHVDASIKKGRGLRVTLLQEYTTPPPDPNFIQRTNKHKEGRFLKAIENTAPLTEKENTAPPSAKPSASVTPSCIGPLLNNGIPFTVVVDHLALVYLITAPVTPRNRKIMTMILNLHEFNFENEYRKGGQHADADAVSRQLRFEDNSTQILRQPSNNFQEVEDKDLRTIFRQHLTYPDILSKIQDLVKRSSTDYDYHRHPTITTNREDIL